jgi:tRNA(Ile)-lysidine synthase
MYPTSKNKPTFFDKILRVLKKYEMLEPGNTLLVAVSGGMDSVALLHTLNRLKARLDMSLHVVHFNHNLRGEESFRDAAFVESLAKKLDLPYTIGSGSVKELARLQKVSMEEAARTLRYRFFYEAAEKVGADKITTAHTIDDQAETLLLRLLQGAGLAGLCGIQPVLTQSIIRPFIETTREEIENFARGERLEYVTDSSNYDKRYVRNRIRWDLLPLLKQKFNARIVPRLATTADLFREDLHLLEQLTEESYGQVCRQGEHEEVWIDLNLFTRLHPALQRRILRKGFEKLTGTTRGLESNHVQSAVNLLKHGKTGNSIDLPGGIKVRKSYERGMIVKKSEVWGPESGDALSKEESNNRLRTPDFELWTQNEEILTIPGAQSRNGLTFCSQVISVKEKLSEDPPYPDRMTASFDYDKLRFPLRIRRRRAGDRFQPSGMKGRKKLQDLFVDLKISREKRDRIPILEDRGGIIWVVGYRMAERVKVDSSTQTVLVCTVLSDQSTNKGQVDDLP